jgi:hypothetical protein
MPAFVSGAGGVEIREAAILGQPLTGIQAFLGSDS